MRSKAAIVTGGGKGLGRAIALRLGAQGYRVGLIGRAQSDLAAVRDEIQSNGGVAAFRAADVGIWDEAEKAILALADEHDGIDVLVNNAGGWMPPTLEDVEPAELANLLSSSVLGTAYCAKAAIPVMKKAGSGYILNIGSTSGLVSSRDNAVSSTPKGAIQLLSRTLGLETERFGIRVSVLHPSSVEKKLPYDEVPPIGPDGFYVRLSQAQVADIALFMINQPDNVNIRELVVTPSGVFR